MFGSKARKEQRRADDLAQRLDTAHHTIEQLQADVTTAQRNQRTAISARLAAEDRAAALEERLAGLQAANEAADRHGDASIPGQRVDGAA